MGHDDTIDALAYACKYAHPPHNIENDEKKKTFKRKRPKVKNWVIA